MDRVQLNRVQLDRLHVGLEGQQRVAQGGVDQHILRHQQVRSQFASENAMLTIFICKKFLFY